MLRRYRMGYIYLNSPICHTSFLENNILSLISGIAQAKLIQLIYFNSLNSDTYISNDYSLSHLLFPSVYILHKLSKINLVNTIIELRNILDSLTSYEKKAEYAKSIYLLNLLILNNIKPNWLFLTIFPVMPAGLRPLMRLDDDVFAVSNINELYKTILIKNNRIKKLKKFRTNSTLALEILERGNLQRTIDILLHNNKHTPNKPVFKVNATYFKNYLLGKRIDFSGRSVITAGPTLPPLHVGVPFKLGLKLFEYHLIKKIKKSKMLHSLLSLIYYLGPCNLILKRLLNSIFYSELVLINRAPTLHRMNIQAFKPFLIEGRAIKLFPLSCSGFNADFDGDQMGLFVLTSKSANKESKYQLINDKNILHPSSFKNILKYSQTIVLGLDILLHIKYNEQNQFVFNSITEALNYYYHGLITLNSVFVVKIHSTDLLTSSILKKYILTSLGKIFLYTKL